MTIITELRKIRLQLNPKNPGFLINSDSIGIALFDLISSYILFFIIDQIFNLTNKLNISKALYYSLVIPIGIIFHLIFKQKTYLNTQLFNSNDLLYKILFVCSITTPIYMYR